MSDGASLIPYFVVVPLAGAFLNALLGKRIQKLPDFLGSLTTLILLGISLVAVQTVHIDLVLVYQTGGWRPPIGIARLRIEHWQGSRGRCDQGWAVFAFPVARHAKSR